MIWIIKTSILFSAVATALWSWMPTRKKPKASNQVSTSAFKKISADDDSLEILDNLSEHCFTQAEEDHQIQHVNISCKKKIFRIALRNRSSDVFILKEIFLNNCYALPMNFNIPGGIIVDIGANIGLTSLYFHAMFPQATIYSLEPFEDNFRILEKNVSFPGSKIKPYKLALLDNSGDKFYQSPADSSCFGGGGIANSGSIVVKCVTLPDFCDQHGIKRINLLKIDCEGCEYASLFNLDKFMFERIDIIIGEFHGDRALELLAFLSQYYEIGVEKKYNMPLLSFTAVNKLLQHPNIYHNIGSIVDIGGVYFVKVVKNEGIDYVLYGPYKHYPPGNYTVNFDIRSSNDIVNDDVELCVIDVYCNSNSILDQKVITLFDTKKSSAMTLNFSLNQPSMLEFRVLSRGNADFIVNCYPKLTKSE